MANLKMMKFHYLSKKMEMEITGRILNKATIKDYYIIRAEGKKHLLIQPFTPIQVNFPFEPPIQTSGSTACEVEACAGSFHILFLLNQSAYDWCGGPSNVDSYLDQAIGELSYVFANSEIPHNVSYVYDFLVYNELEDNCAPSAMAFANNANNQSIRDFFDADMVFYLPGPEVDFDDSDACVSEVGPGYHDAYGIIPIYELLVDYHFPHEVGHVFGAEHQYSPNFNNHECAHPYAFFNEFVYGHTTVMGNGFIKEPFFSNPNIIYFSEKAGLTDNNNAGYISANECTVADFENEDNIDEFTTTITDNASNDCQLILDSNVTGNHANLTFNWYWNTDGVFDLNNPQTNFGVTGTSTIVPDPVPNNRSIFMVMLVVTDQNGNVVRTEYEAVVGGICLENCCPCDDLEVSKRTQLIPRDKDNEYYFVYDLIGRLVLKIDDTTNLEEIDLQTGVYIIRGNNSYSSDKIFISKN